MNRASRLQARLEPALSAEPDADRAAREKRYLKSPLRHLGVAVPVIRRQAKRLLSEEAPTRVELVELVRLLWASEVHEQRMSAVLLLDETAHRLEAADLALVEEMIESSFTWAYVDVLAVGVAGALVQRFPSLEGNLDCWARAESFWLRRSALLALLGPLRRGGGDWDRFQRYADGMLEEREFFIRKAIGWVLRETSKKRPELVRPYVESRLDRLSGLTFREAVKRLPETQRKQMREAYARVSRRAAGTTDASAPPRRSVPASTASSS